MHNTSPLISIISVNFRQTEITTSFLDSIAQISYPNLELILIDNGSQEDNRSRFEKHYPGLKLIVSSKNLGFAGGNNLGLQQAAGDYILMINNDVLVPVDFLEPLVDLMENNSKAGMVSPKIYYAEDANKIQYAGIEGINRFTGRGFNRAKETLDDGSHDWVGPTYFAHGACVLIRKEVFQLTGWLSEKYFLYYEELDFCETVREKGWDIYYCGKSHIYHLESISIGKSNPLKTYYLFRNRWLFMRTWYAGLSYYFFVPYFLLIGVSWHLLRHWWRGEKEHVEAILKSVHWNLNPDKMHLDEKVV